MILFRRRNVYRVFLWMVCLLFLWGVCFWTGCQKSSKPIPLIFLHWNDFHAQNQPFLIKIEGEGVTVGGAAYLAGLLDSLKKEYPHAIALHAGDEFTGTPICSITKGKSQIELLNIIQPDAFTLGNHEFDYGWEILETHLSEAAFAVLCCNVFDSASGQPIASPSIIIERRGVRIGIIGVITRRLAEHVLVDALPGLRVEDPIPIVNQLLDSLEIISDIQVALTHHGINEDKRLALTCPRLDVIVGGHQHTELFEPLVEKGNMWAFSGQWLTLSLIESSNFPGSWFLIIAKRFPRDEMSPTW